MERYDVVSKIGEGVNICIAAKIMSTCIAVLENVIREGINRILSVIN